MIKVLKNLSLVFICAALGAGFSACDDDDMSGVPFVHLFDSEDKSLNEVGFSCLSEEYEIKVESNAEWKVVCNDGTAGWVTVTPLTGSGNATLTLKVESNKSAVERSAKFDFQVDGRSCTWLNINQSAAVPMIKVTSDVESLPTEGGDVTFSVECSTLWDYSSEDEGVTEVSRSDNELVLHFPEATQSGKINRKVTFSYLTGSVDVEITQKGIPVVVGKADLLDIEFKADGTAIDVSPMQHEVITKPGNSLMTYFNEVHDRYVANFRHDMGTAVTSGYYRINYDPNGEFIKGIADGCTFESTIRLNSPDNPTKEVKWFSSMQAGGIGFILPIHTNSKCITFLPNVQSQWRWTFSNVEPKVGPYYHVVGVWNKDEGKSYIYINGVLAGTADAPGDYKPVASGAESFILGGDPGTDQITCDAAWDGEIVTARIYNEPLDAEQVGQLWLDANFDPALVAVTVSDLKYMAECEVSHGYKYNIYGLGFQAGDEIELQSVANAQKYTPSTTVTTGKATVVIPDGLTSGSYKLILKRGGTQVPLFFATFTVTSNPKTPVAPKIIAHRGAHTDGAAENSIEALKKAMDANYFGIELDAWITTDGQLVVHHDGVANGLTFQNCTYDQIKNIKLSNGESLPTFDDFLKTFVEKMNTSTSKLIIEIKTHSARDRNNAAIDKVMEMVAAAGIKDRVEYIAFDLENCKYIVSKEPAAMVGYLMGNMLPSELKPLGINSIDYNSGVYNNNINLIKDARQLGMITNVWTVNTTDEILRFMSYGIDYITTDLPAVVDELAKTAFVEP